MGEGIKDKLSKEGDGGSTSPGAIRNNYLGIYSLDPHDPHEGVSTQGLLLPTSAPVSHQPTFT